jgi:hypothetical protein
MIPEYRDPRFAALDALIAQGWGNVPGPQIERIKRQNGGALPPPPAWALAEPECDEPEEPAKQRRIPLTDAVLNEVIGGCATVLDVAKAMGITRGQAATALFGLKRKGVLEVVSEVKTESGQWLFVYCVVEKRREAA